MIHLFQAWPEVAGRIRRSDRLLLMLDFDGTLAPIVPRPPDARAPAETLAALRGLQRLPGVALAVVSGRGARDVSELLGLAGVHYVGSHGRERLRPGRDAVECSGRGRESVRAACERLAAELADVPGFQVEDKGMSAAAHYRNASPGALPRVERAVRRAVAAIPGLQAAPGKRVFDITPADGIGKGTAVAGLLGEFGGLPLYFGDDTTDEDAFRALAGQAVTVFVGPPGRLSAARYRLADPGEVATALARILAIASD